MLRSWRSLLRRTKMPRFVEAQQNGRRTAPAHPGDRGQPEAHPPGAGAVDVQRPGGRRLDGRDVADGHHLTLVVEGVEAERLHPPAPRIEALDRKSVV